MPDTPPVESELHPDDLIAVDRLEVKCPDCGSYLRRPGKRRSGSHLVYLYLCSKSPSHRQVLLKIPCTAGARRELPADQQQFETELHPDDGFTIADLDVKVVGEGELKESELHPDDGAELNSLAAKAASVGQVCSRHDKEVLEPGRTTYFFVNEEVTVQLLVPHE